nr:choice-of-anchor I family protein [Vibrio sp. Isolate25]
MAACTAIALAGCTSLETTKLTAECQVTAKPESSESSITGLTLLGTYVADSEFDTSAAEIVAYDECSDQLFVVNAQAKRVDVMTLDAQNRPTKAAHINLSTAGEMANIKIGAANSVSVHNGLVAVAIENQVKQENGLIALYHADTLELIKTYQTGALPDMVSFSKDGRYIATANEGEPNSDYSIDPEGSITLVDLASGIEQAEVKQISFKAFNQGESRHDELMETIRISAPGATVAQDLEPEYLTFADDGYLYVALQENNALAKIDIHKASVDSIYGLGGKSWETKALDASNKDKKLGNFNSYPQLEGLYMPDSIASFQVEGETYIATANEGDGREYGFKTTQAVCDSKGFEWDEDDFTDSSQYRTEKGFCIVYSDELRGKDLNVNASHPLKSQLSDKNQLARLKVVKPNGDLAQDDVVYSFGSRSFSLWNANGELVFDSGDEFADIVNTLDPQHLNSSNDSNETADDRSDDKGVEPEAIEVASINGRQYAFIGLERQGGIMVYDVSTPTSPMFINYINNRDFSEPVCTQVSDGECSNDTYNPEAGDLGPESIRYFARHGQHLLAVGNEVSGTTSIYRIEL